MNEEQLAKQIKDYAELAKQNKKVDVASLALAALQSHERNLLPPKEKRWGYLTSIAVPPFGLIFAAKFYFSGKDDGQEAAFMCIILTFVSIIVFGLMFKALLGTSNVNVNQIEQIKPADVQQLIQ